MSTASTATNATLIGMPLAGDERLGDDDGSVPSMSETSEHASTDVDDMSSHYDKGSHDLEKHRQVRIAQKEERHVKVIRVVTFSFILLSSIIVCVIVYLFAKDYDKHDFELEVSSYKMLSCQYQTIAATKHAGFAFLNLFPCFIHIHSTKPTSYPFRMMFNGK